MSSDLIEDLEDDKETSVFLEMNVNGHAFLTITEKEDGYECCGPPSAMFHFSPTPEGFAAAERIASALKGWVDHVKEVGL